MPLNNRVLELYLEDWEFNMNDNDVKRKIAKVVVAGQRALDPSFKSFWNDKAQKLATKYNVNLSEIKQCPEFYNEVEISRIH